MKVATELPLTACVAPRGGAHSGIQLAMNNIVYVLFVLAGVIGFAVYQKKRLGQFESR